MRILITNDDGIQAIGIQHLVSALQGLGELIIVAPKKEQSGAGLGITLWRPLEILPYNWGDSLTAYSVAGTPADCVKAACSIILPSPPDLIVSGINRGSNHGRTLLYSGTVGGVIEGAFRGIPGIAFSIYDYDTPHYSCFEPYVRQITEYVMKHSMPKGTLFNVNFPMVSTDSTHYKVKLTRQGRQYWIEDPTHKHLGAVTMNTKLSQTDDHEESDSMWLSKGYITASPVHVDELTDWHYLEAKKAHFENFFVTGTNRSATE
jgi:5'-nucleotidase